MKRVMGFVMVAMLAGCAGKVDYLRPNADSWTRVNTKTIAKSRDEVWARSVPELSKRFFTINNLDKASGLINVSYSGDPERYVDCGQLTSYVKNARGERTYSFPGARAQVTYETMEQNLYFIDRKMTLEGRVNLIFEEVGPNETRVTANTRYVLSRALLVRSTGGPGASSSNDSIAFNSGGQASFPMNANGLALECVATGRLETEILSAFQ